MRRNSLKDAQHLWCHRVIATFTAPAAHVTHASGHRKQGVSEALECVQWVKQLLQRGNKVVAGVRDPDNASTLRSLKAQHKDQLTILPLDVADLQSISDWSKNLKQEVGNIDVRKYLA